MRDILMTMDTNFWQQFSGVLFGVGFTLLVIWVCLPSRRQVYEQQSKLPLESE